MENASYGLPDEILIIICVFVIAIFVLFLNTLYDTLKNVQIENRKISPGEVWITLTPLFGLIWQFIMVIRISESLKLEFQERGIKINEQKPGYSVGICYCILCCFTMFPIIGILATIGGIVFMIKYWVKINNYNKLLKLQSKIVNSF
ncbi:MAG TPA: hypothetical protein DEP28_10680 [Bacteroidetes bacterium]|nr:hypothetical protein [Bacteroidota bacterium]HCN38252.1 hypothetical protein [Bacteroidota bacterium]